MTLLLPSTPTKRKKRQDISERCRHGLRMAEDWKVKATKWKGTKLPIYKFKAARQKNHEAEVQCRDIDSTFMFYQAFQDSLGKFESWML